LTLNHPSEKKKKKGVTSRVLEGEEREEEGGDVKMSQKIKSYL